MAKNKKKRGTFIHGIAASEHLDSSGERIRIDGVDISSLTKDGVLNMEHQSKEASAIVGKILEAKKILKRADCDSDHQRYFWDKIKMPFVYVAGELFDAVGHQAAKDIAAMLKYDQLKSLNKDTKKLINFSIEGARLDKRGSDILKCIARKVSITITPCNKVCEAEELKAEDLKKIGSVTSDGEMFSAIENLVNKAEEHFPSCQIVKGEFRMPTPTLPSERKPGTSVKPKRTFTPESAPAKMKVGDRIDYTKRPRAKTGREIYGKKEKMISTPAKEMVEEHKELVDTLESPSHKDDKREAKKQRKELKEYKKKLKKKQGVPKGADPATHERCVKEVKEKGHSKGSAYRICNAAKAGQTKKSEEMEKNFVPSDSNSLAPGIAKRHIGEEVQQRIRQKQRPKRMARKPARRVRPSRAPVGPKQNRMARLGMYDSNMRKAIAAGGMGGAPGTAVQGEALRKEKQEKVLEDVGFNKSEALRIISDDAFNNFDKKQELVDFLAARLVGLNKNEILALAKTIAYNYQKSNEVKLMKMLEKNVYDIKTGKKIKPKAKKPAQEKPKNEPLEDLKGHLKKLNQLHGKLKDLHSQLENETKKSKK